MRIIGGLAKKKKLISIKGTIRPTSDRIKETLFNLLNDIEGSIFLDLFAGTGNIGIEALSRGASRVFFVEKSTSLCNIILENLRITNFEDRATILRKDVFQDLFTFLKKKDLSFHTIFADPPYERGMVKRVFKIFDPLILKRNGIFALQHSIREYPQLESARTVKIGDTAISLFEASKLK
jgi:16S rRNA (guanine966-N2)-methyltransferase